MFQADPNFRDIVFDQPLAPSVRPVIQVYVGDISEVS